eukprot:TRINITY_DN675_c0_g1_i1.p1 TRINITY_DN675_c0_g1~~TRINITY_DN675_c0_g1_i1.p1  ORF type:complete len:187 (+),score=42.66 TRINITY_DN675_c0_g1_i1:23-583(+)
MSFGLHLLAFFFFYLSFVYSKNQFQIDVKGATNVVKRITVPFNEFTCIDIFNIKPMSSYEFLVSFRGDQLIEINYSTDNEYYVLHDTDKTIFHTDNQSRIIESKSGEEICVEFVSRMEPILNVRKLEAITVDIHVSLLHSKIDLPVYLIPGFIFMFILLLCSLGLYLCFQGKIYRMLEIPSKKKVN